ncbi:hypothetical protein EMCRGX_G016892 [Ephydatia muelleri]
MHKYELSFSSLTFLPSSQASTNTAAIASSVVITIIVLAIAITVVVILLLLYIRRTSKVSGMQRNAFENAVYGNNGAELNAYDVAKTVYEPVKDNEKTEGKNSVSHTVFICL